MRTPDKEHNRRAEKLGRFVFDISYWIYAVKFVVIASLLALAVLYLIHKPLWLAPIIGYGIFLIIQTIRKYVFRQWSYFFRK